MADNPLGSHIQGCLDEGQPADNERPVLIAFEDVNGNVEVPNMTAAGALPVDIGPGPFTVSGTVDVSDRSGRLVGHVTVDNFPATQPISGTVTANQGTPNAGGAQSWPVSMGLPIPTVFATGTINGNFQTVELACDGYGEVLINTGTLAFTGSITVQVSEDNGATWSNDITGFDEVLGGLRGNLNQLGIYARFSVGGANRVRVQSFGWGAGTATIQMRAVLSDGIVAVVNPVNIKDSNGNGITIAPVGDNLAAASVLWVASRQQVWDGLFWQRSRTPNVFKSGQATVAGSTVLWTPAAGKKIRIMKYLITITDNVTQAAGGVITVKLLDAAGDIAQNHDVFIPAAALNNAGSEYNSGWIDLGNGILSAVANNVLNINLSAALTAGNVRVIACGTEET